MSTTARPSGKYRSCGISRARARLLELTPAYGTAFHAARVIRCRHLHPLARRR